MIALSCDNLTLSFGGDVILDGITFSLNEGDKLGIVGVNGAGKSSLFRIITGEYTPDSGKVYLSRDKTLGVLAQNAGFEGSGTVWEETLKVFSGLVGQEQELERLHAAMEAGDAAAAGRYSSVYEAFRSAGGLEFRSRAKGILKNLGLPEEQWQEPVRSLSGGQKTRLALSCLLLRDPDVLMLDEPTNHLDTEALFWLEEYLRASRKTVLLVSHDRYFLDRTAGKILEIEYAHGRLYTGNYSAYQAQRQADREIQERHFKNQQREIARIEAYIEQQRRWNRERNIIAAESRQKQLDKMVRVERPENAPENIRLSFETSGESGTDVLKAKQLSMDYPGKPLFHRVSFTVQKRERVFITGPNGCGKSTLIKLLAGKLAPQAGEVEYGYRVTLGYYDQENQQLQPENTVLDELWNQYEDMTQTRLRTTLAAFQFRGDDVGKKVEVLSGGEKARLTMAKLILGKMNLLILDEPTNHLDIGSRESLEKALEAFDGTVIAVSHDRYFIRRLATRILDFGAGDPCWLFDYRGDYESYLEYRQKHLVRAEECAAAEPVSASKEQYLDRKREQAEQRRQETRLRRVKEGIAEKEKRVEQIDGELSASDGTDYVYLGELCGEKDRLEEELLALYEELERAGQL